ncbi:MAG: phage Gp37/Gp68 family protein [Bryobacterales bacterium]|jgi:protein gp37|nr:phage Gp37/Gp68 family protein [Bryobacterales bacterium]
MSTNSKIEWTDATWNPVRGCTKISPGCKHCYAERFAERFRGVKGHPFEQGFDLRLIPAKVAEPLSWRKPQRIFVNSMSDLFHDNVPTEYIQSVFEVMNQADWHQYQVLTKRAERLEELSDKLPWAAHIWMGVSVENKDYLWRIDHLRRTKAHIKFLSIEPLLGPLGKINLRGIDWVIVGGESGPGARGMSAECVTDIKDQCVRAGVAFFFKQWGGVQKKRHGRELEGRTWDEMPELAVIS